MPKPFLSKDSIDTILPLADRRLREIHIFPKGISTKVSVLARLELELAYYDVAVQNINHYTTETSQHHTQTFFSIFHNFSFSFYISYSFVFCLSFTYFPSPPLSLSLSLSRFFLIFPFTLSTFLSLFHPLSFSLSLSHFFLIFLFTLSIFPPFSLSRALSLVSF